MAYRNKPKCRVPDLVELPQQLAVDVLRAAGYTKGLAKATVAALHRDKEPQHVEAHP